jgi:hypothetical protein
MHDHAKAPIPVDNDIPVTLALVVAAIGLWLTVVAGGGAIFALTVWVLYSTSLA